MSANAPRDDPRWRRTRRALLDGGRRVMSARGVEAASIREIARAAGVSQPSFYNHFSSKSELARAIARDFFAADVDAKCRAFARRRDPAAAIAANVCHTLGVARRDPVVAWVLVRAGDAGELLAPGKRDELAAMIRAGVDAGRFHDVEPRMTARVIRGGALPVLRDLLTGEAGAGAVSGFAALVLRLLGVAADEARRLAAAEDPGTGRDAA